MFSIQAQRCLYSWFYQTFSLEVSKLCRTVSGFSTSDNKVRSAVKRVKRKRSVIQKNNEENKEVLLPLDSQNDEAQMKILNPSLKANSYEAHDLSESEMKIVTDVIYDILSKKIVNSHGRNMFLDQIRKTFNIPKSVPLNVNPVNPSKSFIFKEKPKPLQLSFPLFNTFTDVPKEELIVKFKSLLPKKFHIGENVVSFTHVLETTRSHNLPMGQEYLLSMKDKLSLENHLGPHLMKYIQEKTPPDFPDPDLPKHLLGYWRSMQKLAKKITEVKGFDVKVTHPVLSYSATADIICIFDGCLVVMDWKSNIGLRNTLFLAGDSVLQAVACFGALNFDVNLSLEGPLHAVVVVCYPNGKEAQTLCLNSKTARRNWKIWLRRLSMFYRKQK